MAAIIAAHSSRTASQIQCGFIGVLYHNNEGRPGPSNRVAAKPGSPVGPRGASDPEPVKPLRFGAQRPFRGASMQASVRSRIVGSSLGPPVD